MNREQLTYQLYAKPRQRLSRYFCKPLTTSIAAAYAHRGYKPMPAAAKATAKTRWFRTLLNSGGIAEAMTRILYRATLRQRSEAAGLARIAGGPNVGSAIGSRQVSEIAAMILLGEAGGEQ